MDPADEWFLLGWFTIFIVGGFASEMSTMRVTNLFVAFMFGAAVGWFVYGILLQELPR